MTTVSVDASKPERVDALWMNSYNYHYPSFKREQHCKYYECYRFIPSPHFRRTGAEMMRRGGQFCKGGLATSQGSILRDGNGTLPAEPICRNKTIAAPAWPAEPRPDLMARPRMNGKEYARWRFETTPVVTTQARLEWSSFVNRCPERFDIQLPLKVPGDGTQEPYFDGGYALKYLRPHLTRGLSEGKYIERIVGEIQGPATDSPFREIRIVTPYATYGK